MLLNLPSKETPEESELKRTVSRETKLLAKVILKKIHKTVYSKTAFQAPEGNALFCLKQSGNNTHVKGIFEKNSILQVR